MVARGVSGKGGGRRYTYLAGIAVSQPEGRALVRLQVIGSYSTFQIFFAFLKGLALENKGHCGSILYAVLTVCFYFDRKNYHQGSCVKIEKVIVPPQLFHNAGNTVI